MVFITTICHIVFCKRKNIIFAASKQKTMQWVILSLISAFLLGFYDIFKKSTVVNNAIIPVLFYSTMISALIFVPFIVTSWICPSAFSEGHWNIFYVEPLTWRQHLLILGKTALILVSWMFSYSAMKNLPITVVGPVNQLRPAISLVLLFIIFREHLNGTQWAGVILAMVSFWLMGRSGKKEGIQFKTNKWVYMLLASALLVALSGVYDKFLLSKESISPATIQAWYTVYDFLMMAVLFFAIWHPKRQQQPFQWRWGIAAMAVFVTVADVIYLSGLAQEAAVIVLIPLILYGVRLVVSFVYGVFFFREKNIRSKIIPLLMVLAALLFMCVKSDIVGNFFSLVKNIF